jgi:kinesin family protein 2/24
MEILAPISSITNTNISDDTWRETFIEYYTTNAPTKVSMVNDKMMARWSGKYEILMKNLIEKYGPLGAPIDQPQVPRSSRSKPAAAPRRFKPAARASASVSASASAAPVKKSAPSIHQHSSKFTALISAATPTLPPRDSNLNVVESKASNSQNGLETSTFTVCTRVRPLLGPELTAGNECYASVVPGRRTAKSGNYTEELLLHTPKVSITGNAKLDTLSQDFDYVFGPDSTNEEIYDLACAPLVKRALNGQVGVIFAYGQTGSGKTHTMSGILDILSTSAIFSDLTDITFSYMEMLGREIKDCLPDAGKGTPKGVQIGEGLNGAVLIRNMKTHIVNDAAQLGTLIQRANATRATAVTAKNETSSRSHGVAILKVKNKKTSVEGTLYVIDLAGSESAKDSKDHDKTRMKETKEINSSLMVLKDCIRARTNAAGVGHDGIHVPYRRNKLTLLMKDVFDIGCSRLCSTVVIANCSPLVSDISHTKNTVKYAAPLRVAVASSNRQKNLELDVFDPALWNNDKMVSWVEGVASGKIDAKLFVNSLTGVQFCALSENEFYARAQAQLGDEEGMMEIAKMLYLGMWTLIVDAKTRKRRPDGSIITPEQEEEERKRMEEKTIERAKVWAEREKHF